MSRTVLEPARIPLDRLTWARWRRAMRDLTRSEVGGRVKLLFGTLLALVLAINGLNVVNSYVGRDFMTAIERRSMSGFVTKAALYIGVFAASTVVAVIYRFTEERLGLLSRHRGAGPARNDKSGPSHSGYVIRDPMTTSTCRLLSLLGSKAFFLTARRFINES